MKQMKHRARIQIIQQILQVLEDGPDSGIGITEILFATSLSTSTLKNYLAVLVDCGLVAIKPPTREQAFLRPAIKRYVTSKRKAQVFLKLYTQSRSEDLICWEPTAEATTAVQQSTTQTMTEAYNEEPKGKEEPKNRRQAFNLFGKSRIPSC